MMGVLLGVVNKIKPLLPDFRIVDSRSGYEAFTTKARYSMGFKPQHVGDEEVHVATISIACPERKGEEMAVVVTAEESTAMFGLIVPNSRRKESEGVAFDWRLDEAAGEVAECLKKLAESL